MSKIFSLGITNYYGAVSIKKEADRHYIGLENYDGDWDWKKISEKLFISLLGEVALRELHEELQGGIQLIKNQQASNEYLKEGVKSLQKEFKSMKSILKEYEQKNSDINKIRKN